MSKEEAPDNCLAVIGMACRFPDATNVEQFWANLAGGVDSTRQFTDEELLASGVNPAMLRDPNYVRVKAPLEGIELFDAEFFGFNPREAAIIDPQQRLFLEHAWEALERAGYDPETYDGAIGVFGGEGINTYYQSNLHSHPEIEELVGGFASMIANDKDFLTTRVAYKLGLKGPAVTVQTACSTSLVAIHMACQHLLSGECSIALAGGVTAGVPQKTGYLYREGGIASPDGRCRAFDAGANGTVGGNGVGVVVLKRLEDALADGDRIHAVVRGSAINNDGSLKVGFTAPSVTGQSEVIADALAMAGVEPDTVSYVEAHGTGTPLGDPIEVAALTRAFRAGTDGRGFCAIGSLKTNIGHLGSAAGVAGFIKTVLALKHRQIPPSLNFERPNPEIDFENSPFYVNTRLADWKRNGTPRRAGVSSFGIGGTNAHVVLEEAPRPEPSEPSPRALQLLLLSARTPAALDAATANLAAHLKEHPESNVADVAYTYAVGRRAFAHRRLLVCRDAADAAEALASPDSNRVRTGVRENQERTVVFMFPGQGSQHLDMGREYYESERVFREAFDACAELLVKHLGCDLRDVLFRRGAEESEAAAGRVDQTRIAQPALFAVEYALAKLWMSWGVKPAAMIGHSVGEYVAACLAGVFSLKDALFLTAMRGRLMQELPGGAMTSVYLAEGELLRDLGPGLSVAAVNGESLCVVSGPTDAVEEFERRLRERGVSHRRLRTSHAFHSEMMTPILKPFEEALRQVTLNPPTVPIVSSSTGRWLSPAEATRADYWAEHIRRTVRFADGLSTLLDDSEHVLLEVGPGQALATLTRQRPGKSRAVVTSMRRPQDVPSTEPLLDAAGQLWLAGVRIDWHKFYADETRRRVPLPTYPFERQRHWIDPVQNGRPAHAAQRAERERTTDEWFYVPVWSQSPPAALLLRGAAEEETAGRWLCLLGAGELGARLVRKFEERGREVAVVRFGEQFDRDGGRSYTLNPARQTEFEAALAHLSSQGWKPSKVVDLRGLSADAPASPSDAHAGAHSLERSFSLLTLVRALERMRLHEQVRLEVLTQEALAVTGLETPRPAEALLHGLPALVGRESAQFKCRLIDVALPEPGSRREAELIELLTDELTHGAHDSAVAYRGGRRWTRRFENVRLDDAGARPARLKDEGCYLLAGALAEPGFSLAAYLAENFRARLILLEPADFPARDQWAQSPAESGAGRKVANALELERLGAEVLVVNAEGLSGPELQETFDVARARFGPVRGAVVVQPDGAQEENDAPARELTPEEAARELTRVAQTLGGVELALRGGEPDFCLLVSPLSHLLGGAGPALPPLSQEYLSAFVRQREDAWAFSWTLVSWDDPRHEARANTAGEASRFVLSGAERVECFRRIVGAGALSQVFVSKGELGRRIEAASEAVGTKDNGEATQAANATGLHPRPKLSNPYVAPAGDLEQRIAEIWQELLGIEQVGVHDDFYELGGHSLLATQLISRLKDAFPVELPLLTIFRDVSTIAEMVQVVEEVLIREIEALPEDDDALRAL